MKNLLFFFLVSCTVANAQVGQVLYDTVSLTASELDTCSIHPKVIAYPTDSTYFLAIISAEMIFERDTIEFNGPDVVYVRGADATDDVRPWAPDYDLFWIVNVQPPPYFQTKNYLIDFVGQPLVFTGFMHNGRHGMGGAKVYVTYVQFKL